MPKLLKEYHLFEVENKKFVYDVQDILVYEIDDAICDYYNACANPSINSPDMWMKEHYNEGVLNEVLEDLRHMGLLVEAEEKTPSKSRDLPSINGITLNVTHNCNLRCPYCFAQQGDYGLGKSKMSKDVAKQAVDWLKTRGDDNKTISIDFFGGEPMMNMDTIKDTVDYANEQLRSDNTNLHYHLTTNGTLLNEKNIDFIARENVDVQISLDGVPEINDSIRVFPNGKGSHEIVARGIERLKKATGKATLRGTIPVGMHNFAHSVEHMCDDLGATMVGFEPASKSPVTGEILDAEAMNTIKAEWNRVAEYFAEHVKKGELKPVGNLLKILSKIHKRKKTGYGCSAGYNHVAIDPSGDIYPCHRFVGETSWKMGNIRDESMDDAIRQQFAENTVDQREPCKFCWARYNCGGRCAHEAMEATGSIHEPDPLRCDLVRHLTELALKLYVRLKPHEKRLFDTLPESQHT